MNINDQMYVNNKWYFDVIDVESDNVKVRIKYYENPNNKTYFLYKKIKLPISIFSSFIKDGFIVKCTINEKELKDRIGGLIDRIVKESDITRLFEDGAAVSGGMGGESMPGLSGIAGVPGSAGSGTITSVLPSNEYGMEIDTPLNKRTRKKIFITNKKGKKMKPVIKSSRIDLSGIRIPVLNILNEDISIDKDIDKQMTDNEYKSNIYSFLDYPTDNDIDIKFIELIDKIRPSLNNISAERIKQYFKNLYDTNKTLIVKKTSEWFQNNILLLADIKN